MYGGDVTGRRGRLPDFLVVGTMKGGTSSLHHYLKAEPAVFMPAVKELNFFVDDYRGPVRLYPPEVSNWSRGVDWYRSWFADAKPGQLAGEVSPNYAKAPEYPGTPQRIAALIPHARLVFVARDPVERVRSHYLHDVAVGRERRPIAEALRTDPRYISTSRYGVQLTGYLEHFPHEQLLVILSEDLRDARAATLGRVLEHLGVTAAQAPHDVQFEAHSSAGKRRPSRAAVRLGRLPGRRLVPRRLRRSVRGFTTRPIEPGQAAIDGDLRAWLLDQLSADIDVLRGIVGPRIDRWPSAASSP